MGITFSDSCCNDTYGKGSGDELFTKVAIDRRKLRLSEDRVQKLVQTFSHHYHLPICGRAELWSLFSTALGEVSPEITDIFSTVWAMFSQQNLCRTQEVLVCLALISDCPVWRTRLSHIFDIFKSTCTNEIFNEDIMLGLEVVFQALLKLWGSELKDDTDREGVHTISEEIAIAAFDKLGKKADDGLQRDEFLLWAAERFKDSKTVSSEDALLRMYRFQ